MSKRSTNFRGSIHKQTKHLRPSRVIQAMRFVGMTDGEIKAALTRKCTCGPTDGCEICTGKAKP